MYDIVSIGELLVDFTECGISPAGMRLFEQNAGGAVTNMVAAASMLGAKTAFIGKVGDDMHGAFLKAAMEKAGVDMHALIMDKNCFTTLAFVGLSKEGEREFSFARKPGADMLLSKDELDSELIANTKVFHTGSLSTSHEPCRTAIYTALKLAKAGGAIISYDVNYRASLWNSEAEAITMMRTLATYADVIKLSDEETVLLTNEVSPEKAAEKLCDMGVKLVAVTLGKKGAYVYTKGVGRFVPSFPANTVDTTGAGDAFFGSFMTRIVMSATPLEELSLEQASEFARFANAAASLCVQKRGGIPSMPDRASVDNLLNTNL